MAKVVYRDRAQPIDWGAVAVVREPLQSILDTHSIDAHWINEPTEGGWLREVHLELDTGGLAYLDEHRQYPGEFTVHLRRLHDIFFFEEDYAEVLAFLNVSEASVTLLTGQVRWWKKKRPLRLAASGSSGTEQPAPTSDA